MKNLRIFWCSIIFHVWHEIWNIKEFTVNRQKQCIDPASFARALQNLGPQWVHEFNYNGWAIAAVLHGRELPDTTCHRKVYRNSIVWDMALKKEPRRNGLMGFLAFKDFKHRVLFQHCSIRIHSTQKWLLKQSKRRLDRDRHRRASGVKIMKLCLSESSRTTQL